jgi:hypothetical protein
MGRLAPHLAGQLARFALAFALALAACSSAPPQLLTLRDQTVAVNTTLAFDVAALDPDTDKVTLRFEPAVKGAQLQQIEGKLAKFTWTPNPSQVGVTTFTFFADDGGSQDTETLNVKVVSDSAPCLVSPDRYVVDPSASTTVKFVLEYTDAESTTLAFTFDPAPEDWGAQVLTEGRKVYFTWEPSAEQKLVAQHSFIVTATDDDGHAVDRTITIVFRGAHNDACPVNLSEPQVTLTDVPNQLGTGAYPISATISDRDSAIQYAIVSWSTVPEPQDGDWSNDQLGGDSEGVYTGSIPNLNLGPGESRQVTFHVCAADDDDPAGDRCDGWGCSENKTFTASAALGLCDPCQAGQCGTGVCLHNARSETFCGADCGAGDTCPTAGFYCATINITGGGTRKQCIPEGCRISASDPTCSCAAGRPVVPAAGDLIINEVLYDPPDACPDGQTTCDRTARLALDINGDGVRKKDESEEEFVELLNVSPTKYLQLSGLVVADADKPRFTFPTLVLPPGRAAIVFGGGDVTKFGSLGGAFKFSSAGTTNTAAKLLQLNNAGDTVTLTVGGVEIDRVTWTGSISNQSVVRAREGDRAAALVAHSNAANASGLRYSPGTHTCGTPFPLDLEACLPPACAVTNQDAEPGSNQRSTAPCVKNVPQTIVSTLLVDPADPAAAGTDPRDLYELEATAGQWLHARTEAGAAPAVGDTVIRLLSRNGTQVADNDDDPWNPTSFYSRLITQIPSNGIYFVEVTPYVRQSRVQGSYRLTLELGATQPQKPSP